MNNFQTIIVILFYFVINQTQALSNFDSKPLRYTNNLQDLEQQLKLQSDEINVLKTRLLNLEERLSNSSSTDLNSVNPPLNNENVVTIPDGQSNNSNLFNKTLDNDDIFKIATKPEDKASVNTVVKKNSENLANENFYNLGLKLYKLEKYTEATEAFNNFIEAQPNNVLVSNAYFWIGEIYFKKKIYEKAAINYLKGYKQFPKGAKAADSLLKLSMNLGELKKLKEACAMIDKLDTDFPKRTQESMNKAKQLKTKYNCK